MWRTISRIVDPHGLLLPEDLYCFASSAISHLLILLAALSIPPGLVWERVEPMPRLYRTVTLSVQPVQMHEIEPAMVEIDLRRPGLETGEQSRGPLGSGASSGPPSDQGVASGTENDDQNGGIQGEGRRYAMYCFGCADCDANPKHPGCGSSSVEVVDNGPTSREVDWSLIVQRAIQYCEGIPQQDFQIRAGALGWVASSNEYGICVAANLPVFHADVWTPRAIIYGADAQEVGLEW